MNNTGEFNDILVEEAFAFPSRVYGVCPDELSFGNVNSEMELISATFYNLNHLAFETDGLPPVGRMLTENCVIGKCAMQVVG